jgi:hypothetical protein
VSNTAYSEELSTMKHIIDGYWVDLSKARIMCEEIYSDDFMKWRVRLYHTEFGKLIMRREVEEGFFKKSFRVSDVWAVDRAEAIRICNRLLGAEVTIREFSLEEG